MADLYLLSIDLGTSSIKAGLFEPDGTSMAIVDVEYLRIPEGQVFFEIDAEAYWQAAVVAIRQATVRAGVDPEAIAALSISSHGETLFCLDATGKPVRPAILTLDGRAEAEVAAMEQSLGSAEVYRLTGQPEIIPIWPAAKIAWLRTHEPEVFDRTQQYRLPQGFLLERLCGRGADDPSVLATTLLFDICTKSWSAPLLAFAGVDPASLPDVIAPGQVLGTLTPQASAQTGLSRRTQVVVGALDQVCAGLAAGNLQPGMLSESTGSVLALLATTSAPAFDGLPVYPHALPGRYCLLPWHATGGLALKWFKDRFGGAPDAGEYESLARAAAGVPPGAEGLVMLPHLEGAQFPEAAPAARGVFFGFGLRHGKGHFVRAILEAVAFLIRRDVEALRAAGQQVGEVVSLGGGAKSELWMQIKADACGLPFRRLETGEAALLGAAMLAGMGIGLFPDLPAAAAAMSRPGGIFIPRPEYRAAYDRAYETYLRLHERLLDLFE